ncbi:DUF5606 family protein [Hufsiella ginkgonis]|uniref:DUF5606 domain-containing protein n=1 Tax=Hufsiella ginkgonis TaxID=2695274 RepID=A0A7K1Y384_9SPHI|nr:DUF5606 domain-containing protein [Hufsiella ginkgonis]MXV17489.1 hypothetical protein [Hufsiella ginkgonis]
MNLRGIISVSGKPGLHKLVGQNKSGFILESLDAAKVKLVVNMSTSKLASLEDITVFGEDDDLKLIDILENMKSANLVPDPKQADGAALRNFFREVAPSHDEERVYASDIKKILSWFHILKDLPLFGEEAPVEEEAGSPLEAAARKQQEAAVHEEKSKPVQKAAGKGSNRLPRKAS